MKTSNEYAHEIKAMYQRTPKAVLAALAVSFAHRMLGGDLETLSGVEAALIEEWAILHRNGIVPQKPPTGLRGNGGSPDE